MLGARRPTPPPLLRTRRHPFGAALRAAALVLAGAAAGLALGLGLGGERAALPPPMATALAPDGIEALRRAAAEEEARLQELIRARIAAETALAALEQRAEAARAAAAPRTEAEAPPRRPEAPPPAPAAPPPPAPAAALPPRSAAATPRVFVHYRAGSDTAREAAEAAARALRGGGFQVTELRGVPGVPAQRVVRYFHDDDAAAAARLAGRLGRGWVIQDFRAYEPSPAPQTLEVWLPER